MLSRTRPAHLQAAQPAQLVQAGWQGIAFAHAQLSQLAKLWQERVGIAIAAHVNQMQLLEAGQR